MLSMCWVAQLYFWLSEKCSLTPTQGNLSFLSRISRAFCVPKALHLHPQQTTCVIESHVYMFLATLPLVISPTSPPCPLVFPAPSRLTFCPLLCQAHSHIRALYFLGTHSLASSRSLFKGHLLREAVPKHTTKISTLPSRPLFSEHWCQPGWYYLLLHVRDYGHLQ